MEKFKEITHFMNLLHPDFIDVNSINEIIRNQLLNTNTYPKTIYCSPATTERIRKFNSDIAMTEEFSPHLVVVIGSLPVVAREGIPENEFVLE
jgi:hypothetical protein